MISKLIQNGGKVVLPKGEYFIKNTITIDKPTSIQTTGKVIFNTKHFKDKIVFDIKSSDVNIENIHFIGQGISISNNRYVIFTGQAPVKNISINNCTFKNWGNIDKDHTTACHAIYISNANNVNINDCHIQEVSGAAIFLKNAHQITVKENFIENTGWYSIHLNHGCSNFLIKKNTITGTKKKIRKHGGAIDLMSQHRPLGTPNRDGRIEENKISGLHSYGSAIRILSSKNILVIDNIIENAYSGNKSPISLIRIGRRGDKVTNTFNQPCHNIKIYENILKCGENKQRGIVVDNDYVQKRSPIQKIWIKNNDIEDNADFSFEFFIILNGVKGGFEDILIKKNNINLKGKDIKQYAMCLVSKSETGNFNITNISDNTIKTTHNKDTSKLIYNKVLDKKALQDNKFIIRKNLDKKN